MKQPPSARTNYRPLTWSAAVVGTVLLVGSSAVGQAPDTLLSFNNASGSLATFSTAGAINRAEPFFQPLGGSYAVTCEHCHFASDGWGLSREHDRRLWNNTNGQHPIFTPPSANDFVAAKALGPDGPLTDRRAAYSLLLDKADVLVRRNFDPAKADFTLVGVIDPSLPAAMAATTLQVPSEPDVMVISGSDYLAYTAAANKGTPQFWLHRRPLPTTNFYFLSTVSWDGKDTFMSANPMTCKTADGILAVTKAALLGRETGAAMTDAKGHAYSDAELSALAKQLVKFMSSTYTAQNEDTDAGSLADNEAYRGIFNAMNQEFHFGINDSLEGDLTIDENGKKILSEKPFSPVIFPQYEAWNGDRNARRASIARGAKLFSSARLTITDVGGFNHARITLPDDTRRDLPSAPVRKAACGSCHDTPGAGSHSTRRLFNIGLADKKPVSFGIKRVCDLPLFYLKNNKTGEIIQTTDPGLAVISGKFEHIGQFKVPNLHGLAARPPYFHNGAANTLEELVEYYNAHYTGHFTAVEKADLVAFLKTL